MVVVDHRCVNRLGQLSCCGKLLRRTIVADSFQRGSVVIIAMLLFIGWWVVLLKTRKPRKLKYRIKESTTEYVTVSIPKAEAAPVPVELPPEQPNDNPYVSPIAEMK